MILVVGGLGGGKRAFVTEHLGVGAGEMSDALDEKPVLYNLQALYPLPEPELLLKKRVVICDEVGCGVVPADREQRARREAVGRLCIELARQAEAVYRVQCGLGMRLK